MSQNVLKLLDRLTLGFIEFFDDADLPFKALVDFAQGGCHEFLHGELAVRHTKRLSVRHQLWPSELC